jgi:hypothetical protein
MMATHLGTTIWAGRCVFHNLTAHPGVERLDGTDGLGPAAAKTAVPFKGSLQATESYEFQLPTMFVDASGSGNATHLGRFTVT